MAARAPRRSASAGCSFLAVAVPILLVSRWQVLPLDVNFVSAGQDGRLLKLRHFARRNGLVACYAEGGSWFTSFNPFNWAGQSEKEKEMEEDMKNFGAANTTDEVVKYLQNSMFGCVEKKLPRTDFELPPCLQLGIDEEVGPLENPVDPSKDEIDRGDREVAAAFVLMYDQLKLSDSLLLAFRTSKHVRDAKDEWGDWGKAKIMSCTPPRRKGLSADAPTDETEYILDTVRKYYDRGSRFLVFVAPRATQLEAIAKLDREFGDSEKRSDLCIALINARLRGRAKPDELRDALADSFNPAFHLRLLGAKGDKMVYRALTSPWLVATKRPGSNATEVWRGEDEPSLNEIKERLQAVAA
eukprot:TRINITY_DN104455_c0_g1_i1.p1 TRINITY_DN104455_c0_g1~~TRINITY_DN104455_c0_g1_i1.p1  ORF type:complete len:370 (-),score=72.97 TRINITY_DN104455_c0_g1_i1:83-1150(-)